MGGGGVVSAFGPNNFGNNFEWKQFLFDSTLRDASADFPQPTSHVLLFFRHFQYFLAELVASV